MAKQKTQKDCSKALSRVQDKRINGLMENIKTLKMLYIAMLYEWNSESQVVGYNKAGKISHLPQEHLTQFRNIFVFLIKMIESRIDALENNRELDEEYGCYEQKAQKKIDYYKNFTNPLRPEHTPLNVPRLLVRYCDQAQKIAQCDKLVQDNACVLVNMNFLRERFKRIDQYFSAGRTNETLQSYDR